MQRKLVIVLLYSCVFLASAYGTMATFSYVPVLKKLQNVPCFLSMYFLLSFALLALTVCVRHFAIKVFGIDSLNEYWMYQQLTKAYIFYLALTTVGVIIVEQAYAIWPETCKIPSWKSIGGLMSFIWIIALSRALAYLSYMLGEY